MRSRDAAVGSGADENAAMSAVTRSGPGGRALGGGGTAGSYTPAGSATAIRSAPVRTPSTPRTARRSTASAAASVIHAPSRGPPSGSSLPRLS